MNLLLDTHALIWFLTGNENLSNKAREAIEKEANQNFISIASIWEITIKLSLGKIELKNGFNQFLKLIDENGFEVLPISFSHLLILSEFEFIHRDPFDRLIIAQAISEEMHIITKDKHIRSYNCKPLW